MNGRALGAALLLVTAVVLAVVPGLHGAKVMGTPVAVQIPLPPTVGDCVLENPKTHSAPDGQLAPLRYGTCSAPHYGEVVEVFSDSRRFPQIQIDHTSSADPSTCLPAINSFLAADQVLTRYDRGDYLSASFGSWQPVSTGRVGLIGPGPQQQEVGQSWVACVTEGTDDVPYTGTVREAFIGGSLPDSYAVCADQLTPGPRVACNGPHRAELFASTAISLTLPSQADLTSSCIDFVRYLTGRTDLSAGGRLQVLATPVYYDVTGRPTSRPTNPVHPEQAQAFCGITTTGAGRLTATIFALHDRPLPLS